MATDSTNAPNNETREAWNTNASVWDSLMGDDGNDFHRMLVRPATERLQPSITRGLALDNQPQPHLYFHRPLYILLNAAFRAGFVLDGLEEPAFPADYPNHNHSLGWLNFSQIAAVLVVRLRFIVFTKDLMTND